MRSLASLLLLLVGIAFVALAAANVVQAGYFVPSESKSTISIGAVNSHGQFANPRTEGAVVLTDNGTGGHDLIINSNVWSTINYSEGTALWTGVPLVSDIRITYRNRHGTYTSDYTHVNYVGNGAVVGPHLGGEARVEGQLVLWAFGIPGLALDLTVVGGPPGAVNQQTLLGAGITMTAGPWVTGVVPMTGITTNVISYNGLTGPGIELRLTSQQHPKVLSTAGGFVTTNDGLPLEIHTVTLPAGNDLLSASQSGSLTLICPIRINTGPSIGGRAPAASWVDIKFIPEPGTLVLLVTGAVGLIVVGRRRARRAGR